MRLDFLCYCSIRIDVLCLCSESGLVREGLRRHCPDLLVEFSLGNYAPTIADRLACLTHRPHLASLCPGSVNFKPTRYASRDPDFIYRFVYLINYF
jgi:hypothetical protein